jgi:hypothetical protein
MDWNIIINAIGAAGQWGGAATAAVAAYFAYRAVLGSAASERPFVGVLTVRFHRLAPGYNIAADVILQNTGRTPARQMRAAFKGYVLPKGQTPIAPDTASEAPKPLHPNTPDFYEPFSKEPILSNIDVQAIEAGNQIPWIIGRVDYFDGSGNEHHTTVCCYWDRSRRVFVPHKDGNDAD